MKKLLLLFLIVLSSMLSKAQDANKPASRILNAREVDTLIFAAVQHEPIFPGGQSKLYEFITQNIKPVGDKGRVFISFVVEKDGSLTDIRAIRGPSEKAKTEAVRIISMSPKWTPGMQNGKAVRVSYTLPINFN